MSADPGPAPPVVEPLTRLVEVAAGVRLAVDEWPGEGRPLLFLHANGFSRGCWRPHAARLAGQVRPIAPDLRGHGASSKPPRPYRWDEIAADVVTLIERRGWRDLVICGHSLGGATAIEAAVALPDRVDALVLVEPVLAHGSGAPQGEGGSSPMIERALRRRSTWPSSAEAAAHLRARAPYDALDAEVFAAWCLTAFAQTEAGAELSCPPWVEASVFAETRHSKAFADLPRLSCPVWLARAAGEGPSRSTCPPTAAERIPLAFETVVPDSGHMLPLERVDFVVGLVRQALAHLDGSVGRPSL